jgi:hypothetical protein
VVPVQATAVTTRASMRIAIKSSFFMMEITSFPFHLRPFGQTVALLYYKARKKASLFSKSKRNHTQN